MSEQRFPWRTLLFVSVAVNLLVIGGIAGALASGVRVQRDNPEAIVARMPGPRAFMAALPAETRAKVRAELVDSWIETRETRVAAREARRAAFAAAAAEPFDAERVKAAFAQLRAADQTAIGVFHDNMIDAFAALSPEERATAPEIHAALTEAAASIRAGTGAEAALIAARGRLAAAGFVVDYVELRRADDLAPVDAARDGPESPLRLLAAARLGRTRLIDNIAV